MRRWASRSLWLLAWSLWAWLGWGLYRELPRDLGPVVCQVPLERYEGVVGFIGDGETLLTEELSNEDPIRLRRRDSRSGAQLGSFEIDARHWDYDYKQRRLLLRHGLIYWLKADPLRRPALVDLATGKWTSFGVSGWRFLGSHPSKPWLAFAAGPEYDAPGKLVVLDGKTMQSVLGWPNERPAEYVRSCLFLEDDTLLVIADQPAADQPAGAVQRAYCVNLRGEELGEPVALDRPYRQHFGPAAGRLTCFGVGGSGIFDVVDVATGRSVIPNR